MNITDYKEYMTAEILMGPNSGRILGGAAGKVSFAAKQRKQGA